jgi:EAL domain-containing protein (putative c-di-GMP-specific phosphodiesterase class I)
MSGAISFDKVKIDKCFIDRIGRPETLAVLGSIVQLARMLNLSIVAEGVETYEQVEKIRSLGIVMGQGYFLASLCRQANYCWKLFPRANGKP